MPDTPETEIAAKIRRYNEAKRDLLDKYPDAIDDAAYPDDDPKSPGFSVHVDVIRERQS